MYTKRLDTRVIHDNVSLIWVKNASMICHSSSWCCCNYECIIHYSVMFYRCICVVFLSSAVSAGRRWPMQWWWSSWSSSPGVSWPHQCWQSVISLPRFVVIVHWTGTEYHLQSVGRIEGHMININQSIHLCIYIYLCHTSVTFSFSSAHCGVKVFLVW